MEKEKKNGKCNYYRKTNKQTKIIIYLKKKREFIFKKTKEGRK